MHTLVVGRELSEEEVIFFSRRDVSDVGLRPPHPFSNGHAVQLRYSPDHHAYPLVSAHRVHFLSSATFGLGICVCGTVHLGDAEGLEERSAQSTYLQLSTIRPL